MPTGGELLTSLLEVLLMAVSQTAEWKTTPKQKLNPCPPITFSDEDHHGILLPHDDALVITTNIDINTVKKILIDNKSSVNIL